jgi:hypothetical protein
VAYWLLKHSGLGRDERKYVLGQAGEDYKLKEIRLSLESLYPQGSEKEQRDGGGDSRRFHHKNWATLSRTPMRARMMMLICGW